LPPSRMQALFEGRPLETSNRGLASPVEPANIPSGDGRTSSGACPASGMQVTGLPPMN
jgi:hypothetical protein